VDLFAEFDSTLIGCERLGRKARLMAMDPGCADVVCRRWEKYTGKAAVLGGDGRTLAQIARLGRKETVK